MFANREPSSKGGARMLPQGVLGFQYEADRSSGGLTSLAGLPL
jgi:hypothetical protein